jgi:two-component system chemotaxis response regulator CheB
MIRVLIADDSELTRVVVHDLLSVDAEIEVVCEVSDGRAAVEKTAELKPDLVIMDVMMPVMDGIEAVAEIMSRTPTPILMLSANTDPQCSRSAFSAIRMGALDVLEKPSGVVTEAFTQIAARLISKVKSLSRIKVIHHYRRHKHQVVEAEAPKVTSTRNILAIGASTGGPKAVLQLLQGLPKNLPATVLIVQHIADGFAPGFADWLDRETALPVRIAEDGQSLQKGQVLVAPTNVHMTIKANRVVLVDSAPLNNCRPAVDALYQSLSAEGLAAETVAVLLTGMGNDGAAAMSAMHKQGAYTIAQNQSSCAVYGMPRAAIERQAVIEVLPLDQIAAAVCRMFTA